MRIENAIDRAKEGRGELEREGRLEEAEAVQLGMEAMRWVLESRNCEWTWGARKLPSETEE